MVSVHTVVENTDADSYIEVSETMAGASLIMVGTVH
jgi:hypothetical protein